VAELLDRHRHASAGPGQDDYAIEESLRRCLLEASASEEVQTEAPPPEDR